jgi:probable F420-dependent oxidoreductase
MRIGVVYPQTEYSTDPAAIREYAQTAEGLGYTHILAFDHVLGANPERPGGWKGPYTYQNPFMEPFLLFSHMAAVTTRIEFVTGVIILPQRQTALVAKQAATLDVLSGGRTRIGVGNGWNEVEYVALNENFHNRGRRQEEQVELLKRLWTEPLITFKGKWHDIPDAGINPLPVQRPIPLWFGGHADPVLRRVAKWGDGWMPNYPKPEDVKPLLEKLEKYLEEVGRSRADIGLEARMRYGTADQAEWSALLDGWRGLGMTHLSITTMGAGLKSDEHQQAIRTFAEFAGVH